MLTENEEKRGFTNGLAQELQSAAKRGDTRIVYKIIETLTRGFTKKTKMVKTRKERQALTNRWAEHLKRNLIDQT